ncbi:hypothetical protein V8C86DRAFT_2684250 [Haematococcus lacustris]
MMHRASARTSAVWTVSVLALALLASPRTAQAQIDCSTLPFTSCLINLGCIYDAIGGQCRTFSTSAPVGPRTPTFVLPPGFFLPPTQEPATPVPGPAPAPGPGGPYATIQISEVPVILARGSPPPRG